MKQIFIIFCIMILTLQIVNANELKLDKVKLQLQWKHQFEFAGFYAAKEKGFYKDVGLDVEFLEYDNKQTITDKVLNGGALYGVTYASIISEYLNAKPVILIANFFKQSPLVLITQADIQTPANLKDKRVMGVSNTIDNITLTAMLNKFGISTKDIKNMPTTFNIQDFIDKKVDAMSVFTTNELYELNKKAIKYNIFDPTAYGTKYYDVNLFTTKKEVDNNPLRVQNFKEASIKGWKYALNHQYEIVELILKKYNTQNKTKESLLFEAKQIEYIMLPSVYKIGSIEKFRIKMIADSFRQAGFIKNKNVLDLDKFIFENYLKKFFLTQKEKEFLYNHPLITLGTGDSWAPYSIKNDDGTLSGYDQDILRLVNKATGANFVLKQGNWSKIQKLAKEKKLDGLSTLTITKEREKFLNFSNIYISLQKNVMVKQRNPLNIHSPKDLDGKTIVIHKGNLADKKAAKLFPNSKIIYANTPLDMLKEVIYGKADATFGNGATEYMLSKKGLPYMEKAFPLDNKLDLRFAVRKELDEAISILNKGLASIPEYERNRLKVKWFLKSSNYQNKIALTKDELLYLKKKKEIKMCVDPNWMPFEKIQNTKYIGIGSNFIKRFSDKINTPIHLVPTKTWSQSLQKIKSKECDILALAEKTPQREKYMNFTTPYIESPIVVATKIGIPFINDIKDILDKKLGVVEDYSLFERLKLKYPNINIVKVNSLSDGLQKVENGTIFGYLDSSAAINYEIQKNFLGTVIISGKFKEKIELSVALRDDEKLLYDIFEKLILNIEPETKQEIMNKWINMSYKSKIDYTIIWKILAISLIVIIIFIYRQYVIKKLNKELKIKIKKELKKSRDKDKMIFQQSKLVSMGEMIENISHQWRQPLSQINSAVLILDDEIYREKIQNNTIQEKLNEIESMTEYMSHTIDDFKNFYKNDKVKQDFYIKESVENVIYLIRASLKYNNIELEMNLDKDIKINGLKNEFEQAILVILNNAKDVLIFKKIKYPQIKIELKTINELIGLTISDNAGGVKEDIIDKIFEPYFTTKHKSQGTGLGLYLSKMILEDSMNAKFYVKNNQEGACFIVEF